MPEGQPFFTATGDIECAFYRLRLPRGLEQHFRLPVLTAAALGLTQLDGQPLRGDELIFPCLQVLPMGWSWALHLCQGFLRAAIRDAGVPDECVLADGRPAPRLGDHQPVAAAGYVDNYAVVGTSAAVTDKYCDRISEELRRRGVTVHELQR